MLDGPRVSWVQGMADPERPRPRVRWVEPGAPPFRQSFVFFKSAPSEEVLLFLVRQRCSIAWLHEAVETLPDRSEEHTSELQSLMRISYAVFCLKKKKQTHRIHYDTSHTRDHTPTSLT